MTRQKLSEYRSKQLLFGELGQTYHGHQVTPSLLHGDFSRTGEKLVVKVDQGIKKRGKLGLMKANVEPQDADDYIRIWKKKGYEYFLVEPMVPHDESEERYLSLSRTSTGVQLAYSKKGGMEIEEYADSLESFILDTSTMPLIAEHTDIAVEQLQKLLQAFNRYHFSFLEVNPFLQRKGNIVMLDAATYVDDTASLFVQDAWSSDDFRAHATTRRQTDEELRIAELAASSQASFRYEVINPDGAIFMLLSGGGASVVLADEVFTKGAGKLLANYGEYSGNPNEEETYLYAREVLRSLMASKSPKKVLLIAGGVANFTDIRATFIGIRRALAEAAETLRSKGVKVYIRRGGPHETEALHDMEKFLKAQGLHGAVYGSKEKITRVVDQALADMKL